METVMSGEARPMCAQGAASMVLAVYSLLAWTGDCEVADSAGHVFLLSRRPHRLRCTARSASHDVYLDDNFTCLRFFASYLSRGPWNTRGSRAVGKTLCEAMVHP